MMHASEVLSFTIAMNMQILRMIGMQRPPFLHARFASERLCWCTVTSFSFLAQLRRHVDQLSLLEHRVFVVFCPARHVSFPWSQCCLFSDCLRDNHWWGGHAD